MLFSLLFAENDAVVLASLAQLFGVQVRVLVVTPYMFIAFSLRHDDDDDVLLRAGRSSFDECFVINVVVVVVVVERI